MDSKSKKFFSSSFLLPKLNIKDSGLKILSVFDDIINYNFDLAISYWEYYLEINNSEYLSNNTVNNLLSGEMLSLFVLKNEQRTYKSFMENATIKRYFLCFGNSLDNDTFVNMCVAFIITQKIDYIDEIFKTMTKNLIATKSYGEYARIIIERVFEKLKEKQGSANISLSKKQRDVLQENINKIKGSERALLTQRIKELK